MSTVIGTAHIAFGAATVAVTIATDLACGAANSIAIRVSSRAWRRADQVADFGAANRLSDLTYQQNQERTNQKGFGSGGP
jgi:hypothetical protein